MIKGIVVLTDEEILAVVGGEQADEHPWDEEGLPPIAKSAEHPWDSD